MRIDLLGEAGPLVAATRIALGRAFTLLGNYDEAESQLLAGIRTLGPSDPEKAREAERLLADLYDAWGRPDEAAGSMRATQPPDAGS